MHEAMHTNKPTGEARQSNWFATSQRHRRGGIRAGAIRGIHRANAGFYFRLAMLQRGSAGALSLCHPPVLARHPQPRASFR